MVQAGLLPTLKNFPGFINFYATKFEDGDLGAVSLFATKAQADKAAESTTAWIKQNLASHLPTDPMVLRGDVLLSSTDMSVGKSA